MGDAVVPATVTKQLHDQHQLDGTLYRRRCWVTGRRLIVRLLLRPTTSPIAFRVATFLAATTNSSSGSGVTTIVSIGSIVATDGETSSSWVVRGGDWSGDSGKKAGFRAEIMVGFSKCADSAFVLAGSGVSDAYVTDVRTPANLSELCFQFVRF